MGEDAHDQWHPIILHSKTNRATPFSEFCREVFYNSSIGRVILLTKPAISDDLILTCLREDFGLHAVQFVFLPLGADVHTAVYQAASGAGQLFFVKLRKGDFQAISVSVPHFLSSQGNPAIIPPLPTRQGKLWASLPPYQLILYPYIEGENGYRQALTAGQWLEFGAALRAIHSTRLPAELSNQIPRETYSSRYRDQVRAFQAQAEGAPFGDSSAVRLAQFMRAQRERITQLVARCDRLGSSLKSRAVELVLCHSDIHAGNLHLSPGGRLYIVDWDNPTFSPKERDLNLVGGCHTWNRPEWAALFYQGYGQMEIDRMALAYYRCDRIIQDIAAYCEQMFLSTEGDADRGRGVTQLMNLFEPGHDLDIAMRSDPY